MRIFATNWAEASKRLTRRMKFKKEQLQKQRKLLKTELLKTELPQLLQTERLQKWRMLQRRHRRRIPSPRQNQASRTPLNSGSYPLRVVLRSSAPKRRWEPWPSLQPWRMAATPQQTPRLRMLRFLLGQCWAWPRERARLLDRRLEFQDPFPEAQGTVHIFAKKHAILS